MVETTAKTARVKRPASVSTSAPEVLTVVEAAKLLRVSKTCVYQMVKDDCGFPFRRAGKKRLRFSRRALLAWLARQADDRGQPLQTT
jgi:excisionase family DNA binding protein